MGAGLLRGGLGVALALHLIAASQPPVSPWLEELGRLSRSRSFSISQLRGHHAAASIPSVDTLDGPAVLVRVQTAEGPPAGVASALRRSGFRPTGERGRVVEGYLPLRRLGALRGQVEGVRLIEPVLVFRHQGSLQAESVGALKADLARNTSNVTGVGQAVGVISDSYDRDTSASKRAGDDAASGDLPSDVLVLADSAGAGRDEGRAMLQVVHDIAPSSKLLFASGEGGEVSAAQRAWALSGCLAHSSFSNWTCPTGSPSTLNRTSANILVDDVTYSTEYFFSEGIFGSTYSVLSSLGVACLSAAGNSGDAGWLGAFNPSSTQLAAQSQGGTASADFKGGTPHNWAGAGESELTALPFTFSNGTFALNFQWADHINSLHAGQQNISDFDIYIFSDSNGQPGELLAGTFLGSTTSTTADPKEVIGGVLPSGSYHLMILGANGTNGSSVPMAYVVQSGASSFNVTLPGFTTGPTSFGHATSQGVLSVGAASWHNTPSNGVTPPLRQPTSSQGAMPRYFSREGVRTPQPLQPAKPDFTSVDNVTTTFFSSGGSGRFIGTSAAAASAAGVAALALQAGSVQPSVLKAALISSAIDMESPGFDTLTGAGLIQADALLDALRPNSTIFGQLDGPNGDQFLDQALAGSSNLAVNSEGIALRTTMARLLGARAGALGTDQAAKDATANFATLQGQLGGSQLDTFFPSAFSSFTSGILQGTVVPSFSTITSIATQLGLFPTKLFVENVKFRPMEANAALDALHTGMRNLALLLVRFNRQEAAGKVDVLCTTSAAATKQEECLGDFFVATVLETGGEISNFKQHGVVLGADVATQAANDLVQDGQVNFAVIFSSVNRFDKSLGTEFLPTLGGTAWPLMVKHNSDTLLTYTDLGRTASVEIPYKIGQIPPAGTFCSFRGAIGSTSAQTRNLEITNSAGCVISSVSSDVVMAQSRAGTTPATGGGGLSPITIPSPISPPTVPLSDDSSSGSGIAGGIVGVILCLILTLAVAVFLLKKRKGKTDLEEGYAQPSKPVYHMQPQHRAVSRFAEPSDPLDYTQSYSPRTMRNEDPYINGGGYGYATPSNQGYGY